MAFLCATGKTSTTGLVHTITQTGGSFTYTYDDNGNITKVVQDGVETAYTYDALGQLTRVDDGQENATWVYEYDQGGNILSKKKYALGVTTGTPVESKTFTYGNSNWRDQLTAVNGTTITYDAIGNPLNDGTWQYTWENGRQLARMQSVDTDASFVYNENGLRVQKTVNGVVTNYTLHGKNVVHMKTGNDELHFFYDASNKPAVVVYNGTPYSYVKNLQGDIVAILNSTGTAVVNYVYDAWGRPISKTGSMASTLGALNPFRYRGYVFDEETGLYYLRSRYYKPISHRFINADRFIIPSKNISMISGRADLYCYCANNPLKYSDINGYVPKGQVVAYGVSEEFDAFLAFTYVTGVCSDGYGNEAEFRTYVGIPVTTDSDDYPGGVGGFGASVNVLEVVVAADTVRDLAGKGCYVGCGADIGFSVNIDAVYLGKYINEIENIQPDGVQLSFGVGISCTTVHMGNSFTLIKMTKENGENVPKNEQRWVYYESDGSEVTVNIY